MNFNILHSNSLRFILFIILICIDQYSKYSATHSVGVTLNDGVSFGLLSQVPMVAIVGFTIIVLILTYRIFKTVWLKNPLAEVLFFAGAVSNVGDRIVIGSVRDWLPLPGFGIYNNLADWYIALAIVLIVGEELYSFYKRKKTSY